VVEDAEACAQHGFRRLRAMAADAPPQDDARRPVAEVTDVRLRFIAHPVTDRKVGAHPPVVGYEQTHVKLRYGSAGQTGIKAELRRAAAQSPDLRRGESGLLEQ